MRDAAGAPILRVRGLSVALPKGADRPFAVEDASFDLAEGEIMCVVGEFGLGQIRSVERHHGSGARGPSRHLRLDPVSRR